MIMVQEHLDLSGKPQKDSGGEITWDWEHGVGNSTGYVLTGKGNLRCTHHHKGLGEIFGLFQAKIFPNFLIVRVCSSCEVLQPF